MNDEIDEVVAPDVGFTQRVIGGEREFDYRTIGPAENGARRPELPYTLIVHDPGVVIEDEWPVKTVVVGEEAEDEKEKPVELYEAGSVRWSGLRHGGGSVS